MISPPPGSPAPPPPDLAARLLRDCLRQERPQLVRSVAWAVLRQCAFLALPWVLGRAVDSGVRGGDPAVAAAWAGAFVVVAAVEYAGMRGWQLWAAVARARTGVRLRARLLRAVLAVDTATMRGAAGGFGDLTTRATRDVDAVLVWVHGLTAWVVIAVTGLVLTPAMAGLDPLLLLVAALTLPVLLLVSRVFPPLYGRRAAELSRAHAGRAAAVQQLLSALLPLRGVGADRLMVERHRRHSAAVTRHTLRLAVVGAAWEAVAYVVPLLAVTAGLLVGGHAVLDGRITVGQLTTFVLWMSTVAHATAVLTARLGDHTEARVAAERIAGVLHLAGVRGDSAGWGGEREGDVGARGAVGRGVAAGHGGAVGSPHVAGQRAAAGARPVAGQRDMAEPSDVGGARGVTGRWGAAEHHEVAGQRGTARHHAVAGPRDKVEPRDAAGQHSMTEQHDVPQPCKAAEPQDAAEPHGLAEPHDMAEPHHAAVRRGVAASRDAAGPWDGAEGRGMDGSRGPVGACVVAGHRHVGGLWRRGGAERRDAVEPRGPGGLPRYGVLRVRGLAVRRVGRSVIGPLDLTAAPGEWVALTGATGSGKSTLLRAMAQLVPASGTVEFGGGDPEDVHRAVGLVTENPLLLHGTITENLLLSGDHGAADLAWAGRVAGLDLALAPLADGLDTQVGEGGRALSGGQRQLVTLARTLLRDCAVLLLDDVTSALDSATEAQVLARLRAATADRVVVLATHSPAARALADHEVTLHA
ncbi:ATP-binding cassette domain-containing protein [Streptomyces sp. NPDC059063]|uniref:ATP-binding cassette domain-containing protein n=1 Tax=unclassified Streptomyces TaxID=2593676 RepID=UPI00368BBA6E